MLLKSFEVVLHRIVDAKVVNLHPCTFPHHGDKVLADVVDVALDRADHRRADRPRPGRGEQGPQNGHAPLHGVGCQQHFRDEEDAIAEINAHDRHARDQRLVHELHRTPSTVQQDVGALLDLLLQSVVEIVVHLLDKLVVRQGRKVQFLFFVQFFV